MDAVSHPLRRRILRLYVDEAPQSASATELAKATQQPLARISYHLRILAQCGLVRLVQAPGENGAGGRSPHWTLDTEAHWLRLMLDFWAHSDLPG